MYLSWYSTTDDALNGTIFAPAFVMAVSVWLNMFAVCAAKPDHHPLVSIVQHLCSMHAAVHFGAAA